MKSIPSCREEELIQLSFLSKTGTEPIIQRWDDRLQTTINAVEPKLSLYQNGSGFEGMADQMANWKKAIRDPKRNCQSKPFPIGSTLYDTGADIIESIYYAFACSDNGQPINEVHIFGHSGTQGLFGAARGRENQFGLYSDGYYDDYLTQREKENGARRISDIPKFALDSNVVFVLHGCDTAKEFKDEIYHTDIHGNTTIQISNYGSFAK